MEQLPSEVSDESKRGEKKKIYGMVTMMGKKIGAGDGLISNN